MNTASLVVSVFALLVAAAGTWISARIAIRRDRADVAEALEKKLTEAKEAGRLEALHAAEMTSLRQKVRELEEGTRADD